MTGDIALVGPHRRWGRVLWGALLSLVLPGLGQVYAGSWHRGILLAATGFLLGCCLWGLTWAAPPIPWALAGAGLLMALILILMIGATIDAAVGLARHPVRARKRWYRSAWFTWLAVSILGIPLAILPTGWKTYSIPSSGDAPSVMVGDTIVVDARSPDLAPTHGDVAVFRLPRNRSIDYVKRVVGVSGDRVQLRDGQLLINSQLAPRRPDGEVTIEENGRSRTYRRFIETLPGGKSYAILKATDQGEANNTPEYVIPAGQLFFLGDNRDNSVDSRFTSVGFVPVANVTGSAKTVLWGSDRGRLLSPVE